MADLGEIVRAVGEEYLSTRATTPFQRKAMRAIRRCRTAEMGWLTAACESCGTEFPLFRSCRNRNCPQCQAQARAEWLEDREKELLPVPYFHVVFTVPAMLNALALYCPEVFYAALLRAAGNALLDVGWSKLKARLGCLTILHTLGAEPVLAPARALCGSGRRVLGRQKEVGCTSQPGVPVADQSAGTAVPHTSLPIAASRGAER